MMVNFKYEYKLMIIIKKPGYLSVFLLSIFCIPAYSASFDCAKAATAIEKSICGNPALGALDDQLAAVYHQAFAVSSAKDELKHQQRDWVKNKRNPCSTDECISVAYSSRITELNQVKITSVAPVATEQIATPAVQQTQQETIPIPAASSQLDSSGLKTQTVQAEGVGSTVELAAQNAAQNALMQVVGSFIDAQKILDKRTDIVDGIRKETKSVSTNIKDYSQGTIKGFKVLDSKQESGLTRVTAEVVVRIDDFHAYIKKLAEGEVAVEAGLFVKMKLQQKQQTNQAGLLFDNIISPIVNGEVIEFTVGAPKTLSETEAADREEAGKQDRFQQLSANEHKGDYYEFQYFLRDHNRNDVISMEITASLNNEFSKNMRTTFESIASKKLTTNKFNLDRTPLPLGDNDMLILLNNIKNIELTDAYLLSDSKQELIKKMPWLQRNKGEKPITDIEITLTGSAGEVLQTERSMNGKPSSNIFFRFDKMLGWSRFFSFNSRHEPLPWTLFSSDRYINLMIMNKVSFRVFIAVDPAASKTQKILVKLVK